MAGSFQYLRPTSPREACALKAEYGPAAAFWAGGTDLLLAWRRGAADFEYCIDLSDLEGLRTIRREEVGLRVGALSTIASLETCGDLANGQAVLLEVARQFATPQIRNTATLGGNLCHAVPSADFAIPLLALDAQVKLMEIGGERTLPLQEFFTGPKQTALRESELLAEVYIPDLPPRSACSFQRMARSAVDIALVNAAVRLTVGGGGTISQARIAMGAVAPVPLRSMPAEEMLLGRRLAEVEGGLLDQVSERAAADTRPITDVRTSAAYRKQVAKVLVRRGLKQVLDELGEAL